VAQPSWNFPRSLCGEAGAARRCERGGRPSISDSHIKQPGLSSAQIRHRFPLSSPGLTGRSSIPRRWCLTDKPRRTGCPACAWHDSGEQRGVLMRLAMRVANIRVLAALSGARALRECRPRKQRALGRPGADRTHGPRATRKHAAEPQVTAEHPAFPARWLYGLYVLSPVRRAFWPPSPRRSSSARLGISVGMPGPHDFAVRAMSLVS
jgi:hypothetical protein